MERITDVSDVGRPSRRPSRPRPCCSAACCKSNRQLVKKLQDKLVSLRRLMIIKMDAIMLIHEEILGKIKFD